MIPKPIDESFEMGGIKRNTADVVCHSVIVNKRIENISVDGINVIACQFHQFGNDMPFAEFTVNMYEYIANSESRILKNHHVSQTSVLGQSGGGTVYHFSRIRIFS